MKTKNRGFTLAELLIVLAILALFGVLIAYGFRSCSHDIQEDYAREGAKTFALEMQIKDPTIYCASQDSDGDGYVSCTVGQKLSTGEVKTTAVECAGAISFSKGCRLPKAVLH